MMKSLLFIAILNICHQQYLILNFLIVVSCCVSFSNGFAESKTTTFIKPHCNLLNGDGCESFPIESEFSLQPQIETIRFPAGRYCFPPDVETRHIKKRLPIYNPELEACVVLSDAMIPNFDVSLRTSKIK